MSIEPTVEFDSVVVDGVRLEVAVYISSNLLVGRPRPPVDRLETISTDSCPSGHMAAAVALYLGLTTFVAWHQRRLSIRIALAALGTAVVAVVAASRLYLGMHYPTDIVAGMPLGLTAVLVSRHILARSVADTAAGHTSELPPRLRRLDLVDD